MKNNKGDHYKGNYLNDKKCGFGIYKWASGNIYAGEYFYDYRQGYGEMMWTDGSYYRGQWENGNQSGEGEIYYQNELKFGLFSNNVLISEMKKKESDVD